MSYIYNKFYVSSVHQWKKEFAFRSFVSRPLGGKQCVTSLFKGCSVCFFLHLLFACWMSVLQDERVLLGVFEQVTIKKNIVWIMMTFCITSLKIVCTRPCHLLASSFSRFLCQLFGRFSTFPKCFPFASVSSLSRPAESVWRSAQNKVSDRQSWSFTQQAGHYRCRWCWCLSCLWVGWQAFPEHTYPAQYGAWNHIWNSWGAKYSCCDCCKTFEKC